jgi:hypothetical protein
MVALMAGLPRLGGRDQVVLVLNCIVVFVLLLLGFGSLSAPPHVHDASNHAALVSQILTNGSMAADKIWTGLAGRPARLYFPGWHAGAALIAQTGGVAAYVSCWFFPFFFMSLLPASLVLLWRSFRVPLAGLLLGSLLVATNKHLPGSIWSWGGFGQIVGIYLVPPVTVLILGAWRVRSVYGGVFVGFVIFSLMQIHAAEIMVVLVLAGIAGRLQGLGWVGVRLPLAVIATWVTAAGSQAWTIGQSYSVLKSSQHLGESVSLATAVEDFIGVGGRAGGLKPLVILGLLLGFVDRRFRPLAWISLICGLLYLTIAVYQDPVSRVISIPFHQQAARILYLQIYVMPPLMALPAIWLYRMGAGIGSVRVAKVVVSFLLILALQSAFSSVVKSYRSYHESVPFTAETYRFARRLESVSFEDSFIANFWDDGSTWAMHVSGHRFLLPCSWPLLLADGTNSRDVLAGLIADPWPPATRRLRKLGIDHVYVSDEFWPPSRPPLFARDLFATDARFQSVVDGPTASVYKIHWDTGG